MNSMNRPVEAVLPTASRPQVANAGRRKRVLHLSRNTRVHPNTIPCGLPNKLREQPLTQTPGPGSKGHSYRNAVFQALLNTPMLVNFVRMHSKRNDESKDCPIKPCCLTCAMARLASYYWVDDRGKEASRSVEAAHDHLWSTCQKTFWPKVFPGGRIGPGDMEQEFYTDTFLLHFLTEMRNQLEFIPGEYQTFDKMFTVHTARRWRCSNAGWCSWIGPPYKWESSTHLSLVVQKPTPKTKQTPVLLGIQRGLSAATKLAARRGSTALAGRCEICRSPAESRVEIVNLPEVLIVVRNTDELALEDNPDIDFGETLDVSQLASMRDTGSGPKLYELISGVGELRYSRVVSRSYAFARGAEDIKNRWFTIMDESVVPIELKDLEMLQRSVDEGGHVQRGITAMCPEILMYRRIDHCDRHPEIDQLDVDSPVGYGDFLLKRKIIARSINDIFTQRIGRGLLKFAVKITPADPGPQEDVEVDLKLSYELNGKHYGLQVDSERDFIGFHLSPFQGDDADLGQAGVSPFEGSAFERAAQRILNIYPSSKADAQKQIDEHRTRAGLPDENAVGAVEGVQDSMDLDPRCLNTFSGPPEMMARINSIQKKQETDDMLEKIIKREKWRSSGVEKKATDRDKRRRDHSDLKRRTNQNNHRNARWISGGVASNGYGRGSNRGSHQGRGRGRYRGGRRQ